MTSPPPPAPGSQQDKPARGLDEDCADGLHDYCLTDGCTCFCHVDHTGPLIDAGGAP